jgi:hypothetical protein
MHSLVTRYCDAQTPLGVIACRPSFLHAKPDPTIAPDFASADK